MTDLSSSPYATKIRKPTPLRSGIPKLAGTPVKTKLPANSRVLARSTSAHSPANQLSAPSDDNPPNTPSSPVTPTKAPAKTPTRKSPTPSRAPRTASTSSSLAPSYAKPTFAIAARLPAVTRSSIPQPRGILKKTGSPNGAGPISPRSPRDGPLSERAITVTERLSSSQLIRTPSSQTHSRQASGSKSPRSPRSPTTRGHVKGKASTSITSTSASPRPPSDSKPSSNSVSRQPSLGAAVVPPADEDELAAILASAKQAQAQVAEVEEEEAEIARPPSFTSISSIRGHSRGASVASLGVGHELLDHDALDDIDVDTDLDAAFGSVPLPLFTADPVETNSAPPAREADVDPYADDFDDPSSSIDTAVYDAPVKVSAEEKEQDTAVEAGETAVQEPLVERERSTGSVIFIDASRSQQRGGSFGQAEVVTADGPSKAVDDVVTTDNASSLATDIGEHTEADGAEGTDVTEQPSDPTTLTFNITLDADGQVLVSTQLPAQPAAAQVEELPAPIVEPAPVEPEVAQASAESAVETVQPPESTGEAVEVVDVVEGEACESVPTTSGRSSVGSDDGAVVDSFNTIIIDRDPLDRMDPQVPTPVTRTPNVTVSERIHVPDTVREDSASSHLGDQPGRHSLDADPEPEEADPERDVPPTRTPAVSNAVPFAPSEQSLLEAEGTVVQSTLVSYDTSALEHPTLDVPTAGSRAPAPTTTTGVVTTPTKQVAFADKVTSVEAPHPLEDSDIEDLDFGIDDAFPKTPDRPSIDDSSYTPPDPIINPPSSTDPLLELKRLEAARRAEEDKRATDARLAQEAAARRAALDKAEDEKFEREKEILAKEKVSAQLEESKKALFASFDAGMKATKLGQKGSPHITRVYVKQVEGRWVVGWDSKKKAVGDAQIPLGDARCVVGAEEGMFLHRRYAGKYDGVKGRCVSVVSPVRGLDLVLAEEAEVNQWVAMMRLLNVKVVD